MQSQCTRNVLAVVFRMRFSKECITTYHVKQEKLFSFTQATVKIIVFKILLPRVSVRKLMNCSKWDITLESQFCLFRWSEYLSYSSYKTQTSSAET